jgi:hypothetical protein
MQVDACTGAGLGPFDAAGAGQASNRAGRSRPGHRECRFHVVRTRIAVYLHQPKRLQARSAAVQRIRFFAGHGRGPP